MKPKTKRIILYSILFLVLLAVLGIAYINYIFLPIQLKQIAADKAQQQFGRKIEMGEMHFNPFQGITINNLTIYRKNDDEKIFAHLDEATFSLLYTPFLKNKKIIIPSISIENLSVNLIRDKNREWNFEDLQKPKTNEESPYDLLIGGMHLENAAIRILDHTTDPTTGVLFEDTNLHVVITPTKVIKYTLDSKIAKANASIKTEGMFFIKDRRLTTELELENIPLDEYTSFLPPTNRLVWNKGQIKSAALKGEWSKDKIDLKGDIRILQTDFILPTMEHIKGNIAFHSAAFVKDKKTTSFRGNVFLSHAQFKKGPDQIVKGSLEGQIRSLSQKENQLVLDGDIKVSEMDTQWKNQLLKGDLHLTKTKFRSDDQQFNWQGDLTFNNAHVQWADNQSLKGQIKVNALDFAKLPETIQLKSNIAIDDANIQLDNNSINGNLTLEKVDTFISKKKVTFTGSLSTNESEFDFNNRLLKGDVIAEKINVDWNKPNLIVASQLDFFNTTFYLDDDQQYIGNPEINLSFSYNTSNKELLKYEGNMKATDDTLTNVPQVGNVEQIQGTIAFVDDQIKTDDLSFYFLESHFNVKGSLKGLNNPHLNIDVQTDHFALEKATPFFANHIDKHQLDIKGTSSLKGKFVGFAKEATNANIEAALSLNDTIIRSRKLNKTITELNGDILFSNDLVVWKNLTGLYEDKEYLLNGKLTSFSRPSINTKLVTDDTEISTVINLFKNGFHIADFKGQYFKSKALAEGIVKFPDGSEPEIDITADIKVELEDLPWILPEKGDLWEQLDLKGRLTINGKAQGPAQDWKSWLVSADISCPVLSLKGYRFDDVNGKWAQVNGQVQNFDLTSNFYDGLLQKQSTMNLRSRPMSFNSKLQLERTDLQKLKMDTPLKEKQIAGTLSSIVSVGGPVNDPDALRGDGAFRITNGLLWEVNLLKGLLNAMVIPELSDISIHEASASFFIHNSRASTTDLTLVSPKLTLVGSGWVSFDQFVDLNFKPQIDPTLIHTSDSALKRAATSILSESLLSIKATGPLNNPKYVADTSPGKTLKKTVDGVGSFFEEGLGLFEEIF